VNFVEIPQQVFSAGQVSALLDTLGRVRETLSYVRISGPEVLRLCEHGRHLGYLADRTHRYSRATFSLVCNYLAEPLLAMVTDLSGATRSPGRPESEYSKRAAVDLFNTWLHRRFARIPEAFAVFAGQALASLRVRIRDYYTAESLLVRAMARWPSFRMHQAEVQGDFSSVQLVEENACFAIRDFSFHCGLEMSYSMYSPYSAHARPIFLVRPFDVVLPFLSRRTIGARRKLGRRHELDVYFDRVDSQLAEIEPARRVLEHAITVPYADLRRYVLYTCIGGFRCTMVDRNIVPLADAQIRSGEEKPSALDYSLLLLRLLWSQPRHARRRIENVVGRFLYKTLSHSA